MTSRILAHRLAELGNGLTLRTFSETRLAFLQDALENVGNPEERIMQRLKIASVLMEFARWEECEEQQRLALAEAKELADAKLVAETSYELAQLLQRTGCLGEAETLLRRALEDDEAAFGEQHPTTAIALNNLAMLLKDTNQPEEAEMLMRRALEIDEAAFGEQIPITAIALNNLAMLLRDTNRIDEAETLMRRALEIDEAAFGEQHPTTAIALNNLAMLLKESSRIEEAETLMRRALEIDEAAFGEQHPTTATSLNNLAMLLKDTNRIEEAEPLMRRGLEIAKAAFGGQHPTTATRLNNLAMLLKDTNRIEEAEPLMRRALEIDEAAFGEQHPTTATSLNNLAMLLKDTNRIEEAESLMRRSIDILNSFCQQTGHEHAHFQSAKRITRHSNGPRCRTIPIRITSHCLTAGARPRPPDWLPTNGGRCPAPHRSLQWGFDLRTATELTDRTPVSMAHRAQCTRPGLQMTKRLASAVDGSEAQAKPHPFRTRNCICSDSHREAILTPGARSPTTQRCRASRVQPGRDGIRTGFAGVSVRFRDR